MARQRAGGRFVQANYLGTAVDSSIPTGFVETGDGVTVDVGLEHNLGSHMQLRLLATIVLNSDREPAVGSLRLLLQFALR